MAKVFVLIAEVLVCILDQQETKDAITKAAESCQIKVDFFCLPCEEDLGTVETLLLLYDNKKIKVSKSS